MVYASIILIYCYLKTAYFYNRPWLQGNFDFDFLFSQNAIIGILAEYGIYFKNVSRDTFLES